MCPEIGACAQLAYRSMQRQHGGVRVALRKEIRPWLAHAFCHAVRVIASLMPLW